jgi:hypothetical protein
LIASFFDFLSYFAGSTRIKREISTPPTVFLLLRERRWHFVNTERPVEKYMVQWQQRPHRNKDVLVRFLRSLSGGEEADETSRISKENMRGVAIK